jgi:class 3 adenylate cyclase/tetratricopeptide (TPR) repeat protein
LTAAYDCASPPVLPVVVAFSGMPVCATCGHDVSGLFKFCPECGAPAGVAGSVEEQRRVVTVVFCDLTGSTSLGESLDAESLRALLARYFEGMKTIVERHGGTVEKFVGDAVMAVFGVPRLHEDDALRAVRAACEMRASFPALGVEGRIGVATGEVVTGTEERLVTGDAVNVAARLEQAAQAGEVLIGVGTFGLVRDVVEAERLAGLVVKGKSNPVAAWRVVSVTGEPSRRGEGRMVGRDRQRRLLQEVFCSVRDDRACHLVTMLGAAGVGKSRLVAEFLAEADAMVVRGRCLSYGEGITYWPVVEVLKQLGTRPEDDAAAAVIGAVLGEATEPTTADDIAWAVRKTLEHAAWERPLVCVFDDLHWGEPALFDLVEHVADFSRDAPILLLCVARTELFDRRPGWPGGKLNATTVLLEPLTANETDKLIEQLAPVDASLRVRIREAAEGNPLFVEEMVAMIRESGDGEVVVPPTIQALLAARLDQLDAGERALLARGAVEGKVFHRGGVEALAPDELDVRGRLMVLVRKELVRPERAVLVGDDAYRFRHLLIRDAAYDALPKAMRADLHERFAAWLEVRGADLVEVDEILGYHLEQALRYRAELGIPEAAGAVAASARARLAAAGRRALIRHDFPAAANLLARVAALTPHGELNLGFETDRMDALFALGNVAQARTLAQSLAERSATSNDRVVELCARIQTGMFDIYLKPEGAADNLAALTTQALPELEAAGDDLALCVAYQAVGAVANMKALSDVELDAYAKAITHARKSGQSHREANLLPHLCAARLFGSTPAADLLAWVEEQDAHHPGHPAITAHRAAALAMLGRFDQARTLLYGLRDQLADRGATIPLAAITAQLGVQIELLAGSPSAAVRLGQEGCQLLEQSGERAWLSTAAGYLAQAHYALDQLDQADIQAGRAAQLGASDDAATQVLWRHVRAKVLARQGKHTEAEQLAREAVTIANQTHHLNGQADAYADLAEVLALAGKTQDATDALTHAKTTYAQKGNLVSTQQARHRLTQLAATPPA